MLTRPMSPTKQPQRPRTQASLFPCEISRLLSAAVINKRFRALLLSDPAQALSQGFGGEEFSLDCDQKALILSIRSDNLSDFARQLTSTREKATAISNATWIPVNQPTFVLHAK